MNVTVQRYVAIYHHEFGVDSWVFDYVPTKELPVPSVKRVVEYFNVNYEPWLGTETLELVRVNDPANLETLTAEQVGGDGVSIETFEEEEDEEPPEPDDPDEPPYRWL
jgi:hypothetical protein